MGVVIAAADAANAAADAANAAADAAGSEAADAVMDAGVVGPAEAAALVAACGGENCGGEGRGAGCGGGAVV